MASLSDCPQEIIEVVLDFLQDDLRALKACSRTCVALSSLCRRYIFHSLDISHTPWWYSGNEITEPEPKDWHFLDANPTILDYIQKLKYRMSSYDLGDEDVPWVLNKLHNHNVRSFQLIGLPYPGRMSWPPLASLCSLGEALLRVMQSPSITCLSLFVIADFPIIILRACVNLTELTLHGVDFDDSTVHEQESLTSPSGFDARIPQLQTFTCETYPDQNLMCLLKARHPIDGQPVLDLSNVQMLNFKVDQTSDLAVPHAFINATNKLEFLLYRAYDDALFTGMAASINNLSLSTLKRLHFTFNVYGDDNKDPLYGICKELNHLSGHSNVIEEISMVAQVHWDHISEQWGMVDTALSKRNGFPRLRRVSIDVTVRPDRYVGQIFCERELDEIPTRYLPWLSSSKTVLLSFLGKIDS